jgi:hypothetical protein
VHLLHALLQLLTFALHLFINALISRIIQPTTVIVTLPPTPPP